MPNVAPKNISVVRTSHTTISVTWTLLTLIEARGFIRYYSVSYTPNTNGRKRQASLETMYVNVSNASTSATITGLEQSLTYNVQVAAATSAGIGVQSPPSVAKIFPTPGTYKFNRKGGKAWDFSPPPPNKIPVSLQSFKIIIMDCPRCRLTPK